MLKDSTLRWEIWVNSHISNYPMDIIEFEILLNEIVKVVQRSNFESQEEELLGININLN